MARVDIRFNSRSPRETIALAKKLAALLQGGEIIFLVGELGAGKTLFAGGLLAGLGHEGPYSSPTFILQQEYPDPPPVLHMDLFRLEHPWEIEELALEEYIGAWIILIEWADRFSEHLPAPHIEVFFTYTGSQGREITLRLPAAMQAAFKG